MKIAIAQTDPVVGAFAANVQNILIAYERACQQQARLLLTPELGICGYPPHDLSDRPEMVERCDTVVAQLMAATQGQKCALAIGHIIRTPGATGRAVQNAASILENGKLVFQQCKSLLPTYDVFDEARYFEPATDIKLWNCDGIPVGVAICEDLWSEDDSHGRRLYRRNLPAEFAAAGAQLVLSLSASPYQWGKRERRERLHSEVAARLGTPLVYVNQVAATDEILFDGGSFAVDAQGKLIGRLPYFSTAFGVVEIDGKEGKFVYPSPAEREDTAPADIEILSRALVRGIGDYFRATGFKTAILGLSGGIDSAVVATLAAKALGSANILGVAMPSQHSSGHSLEDAEALARNLGIRYEVRPIKFLCSTFARELSEGRGELAPLALENLQARMRANVLLTLSNHLSALVLTTGNKSEMATGYCTMYGDMAGAIAPIGDVLKTRVYELARYLNQAWGNRIPERSISKAPSAELRPGQMDQDNLPPYPELDAFLGDYIEKSFPLAEIKKKYGAYPWLPEILRKIELSEFKRKQAAPVLITSSKAFGIGRRIPIARVWEI